MQVRVLRSSHDPVEREHAILNSIKLQPFICLIDLMLLIILSALNECPENFFTLALYFLWKVCHLEFLLDLDFPLVVLRQGLSL